MIHVPGPVLLDLNTQRDLFQPEGAFPVFQFEKVLDPLKRLFSFAGRIHLPVVSTRLHHLTIQGQRGTTTKLVCNPSTPGYQKVPFTLLRKREEMPLDCGTSLPVDGFHRIQQYVFDLVSLNLFECPRLDRLLSEGSAEVYLIAGAPLEHTVRTAVLGLLQRRQKVAMVSDCIGQWDPYEGDMALRQIESKNIEWLTADQVVERFSQPKPRPRPVFVRRPVAPQTTAPEKEPATVSQPHPKGRTPAKGRARPFRV